MSEGDPRWVYLQDIVQKTLNVKSDKWNKFIGNEELKTVVQQFFDGKETLFLVVTVSPAGMLHATNETPEATKAKGLFLTKNEEMIIPKVLVFFINFRFF